MKQRKQILPPHTPTDVNILNVKDTGMSNKLKGALKRNDILTIDDLMTYTEDQFANLSYVGEKTVKEAKELLSEMGCSFAPFNFKSENKDLVHKKTINLVRVLSNEDTLLASEIMKYLVEHFKKKTVI